MPAREHDLNEQITIWLNAWRQDEEPPLDEDPLAHLYQELSQKASALLRGERVGHTLETSALVHETYLRLSEQRHIHWQNRAHFMALAARMMRRVLSNYARDRGSQKRGGGSRPISLDETCHLVPDRLQEIASLDEGLRALAKAHPEHAKLVELRFFGGLSRDELSEVLQISTATVTRRWILARAWLHRYLRSQVPELRGGPAKNF